MIEKGPTTEKNKEKVAYESQNKWNKHSNFPLQISKKFLGPTRALIRPCGHRPILISNLNYLYLLHHLQHHPFACRCVQGATYSVIDSAFSGRRSETDDLRHSWKKFGNACACVYQRLKPYTSFWGVNIGHFLSELYLKAFSLD